MSFRLTKEKTSYEKEVIQEEKRIEKMKEEGKDEYDIKKQVHIDFLSIFFPQVEFIKYWFANKIFNHPLIYKTP